MTYKEAIEQLMWYFESDNGIAADNTTKKAYRIAVKVLKQYVDKSTPMDLTKIKHYPIGDVKITFSSKELKDEFEALFEDEAQNKCI